LRQIDQRLGLSRSLAGCFADTRDQRFVDQGTSGNSGWKVKNN